MSLCRNPTKEPVVGRASSTWMSDRRGSAQSGPEHSDTPIFASFPGVGPILTGVLPAEIGEDHAQLPTPAVLLAESRLALVTRASGRSRKDRLRYAANTILREAAMWWAYNSMKEAPGQGRIPRRP